jgi:hypothetical protein
VLREGAQVLAHGQTHARARVLPMQLYGYGRVPMPLGNSGSESRRDSGTKPRVTSNELPWVTVIGAPSNPKGVASRRRRRRNPVGVKTAARSTQGSSFLATLGLRTQSLWDCMAAPSLSSNSQKALGLLHINKFVERQQGLAEIRERKRARTWFPGISVSRYAVANER